MKILDARFGRIALAAGGALLMLAPVALVAQSDDERRRAVGDWLVEDVAGQDGTRTVQIRREEGDYSLDYHMWLRPGADRVESHGFLVARLNCANGMEESTEADQDTPVEAAAVRARLVEYLDRCEAPPGEAATLLQGYERAFQLADEWAAERLAGFAVEAAAAAVEAEGDMDMSMEVDAAVMNAAEAMDADDMSWTDMNWTDANASDTNWTDTNSSTDADPQ